MSHSTHLRSLLLSTVMTCTMTGVGASFAVAQTADTSASKGKKDEIIVTARRREETLQQVPVAVTAFSGVELDQQGAIDITHLNQVVPNVTIETSRSTNTTLTAFIRGVGQQDPVAGFEQGVGLYLDDVYLNRPQGALVDIYEVERVEVLRGPQGTLYGRNTIGGAIKYVTKRINPNETEASLKASVGSYWQRDLVASASAPFSDTARVGVTLATLNRNGFGENLTQPGVDNYNKKILAGRASFEFEPTENLSIRVNADITSDTSDPKNGHRLVDSQFNVIGGIPVYPVLENEYDTRADLDFPDNKFVNKGVALTTELEINDAWTIKNILAYRDNEGRQQIDFDSLPVEDIQAPYDTRDNQLSEELQLLYSGNGIDGLFGFYYLDASAANEFDVILGQLGALISLPRLNAFTAGEVDTKTWSVFGDVTFDLEKLMGMSGFELSLGGRYTDDKRTGRVLRQTKLGNSEQFGGTPLVLATTSDFTGERTDTDFSPRISLAYDTNAGHNLYVSYAEGFKGGGFDPRGQSSAAPDFDNSGTVTDAERFEFMTFEPENITTYEAGLKSSWADGRINTQLAVFYSDYKNAQIPGSIGVDTTGDGNDDSFAGVTSNAGKATMKGFEFEGNAVLAEDFMVGGDRLNVHWGVGYIDASYDEFIVAVTTATGTTLTNVADSVDVQNTPDWTLNIGGSYSRPLTLFGNAGKITISDSLSYRSSTQQFETASPIDQEGYALFDANMVWAHEDGNWSLGLHGRNLFDQRYKVAGYDFFSGATATPGVTRPSLGLDGTLTAFYGAPRTVTATLKINY